MSVIDRIDGLRKLAAADADGDASAHHAMLRELRLLQVAVETPIETTSRLNFQILQNICLRVAVEKGFLQSVVAADGKVVLASDLARRTNVDVLLISKAPSSAQKMMVHAYPLPAVRVMRVLISIGVVSEADENTYAANAVTRHQVTSGAIGALKHHFDLDMKMGGDLVAYMRRRPDDTIYQFAGEPEGCQTLFDFSHGHPTIFGLLSSDTDKGREQKQSFDDYMASKRPPASMQQWFDIYPAASRLSNAGPADSETALIVDVGGGPGQELIQLKAKCPELPGRFVLQDLPITLDRIGNLPAGIEKMPYDFFTPQPIKHARVYFMRDIMHNWSDVKCSQILGNIAAAMDKSYSTLLIDQYVLPAVGADLRAAEMDILMWLHTSGLQRTASMWEQLLSGVGLRVVKIWDGQTGMESVIEVEKL
ncbi:hypothetical protein LTR36_007007 [Oleoguttula mirabilis]|uniref:O-methyltransferase C-terminal domain-containing protein n=1 Tax=Oleoguttula mirabilis TaxID=1507867 RepID=A0AAV9JAK1_9PEZI|nr:hypothetical protein LTR36_007007 [Oleoguttula mirabilis]